MFFERTHAPRGPRLTRGLRRRCNQTPPAIALARAAATCRAMGEAFHRVDLPSGRAARYAMVAEEIAAVLEGESNLTARMSTVASMLASSFDHYFWTGFYVVDPARDDE